ncbi:uncharacterized protein BDR25DRAFT_302925 [Lindgomyces ingoldianus]|uniref:Uncharacterized protein n=1 Tax=Lindgomyces ingoldianus TaxID=673940 RepID=A0ACB6R045_9PLEO|nr:uncharacterized protein BDR25DRAFT_302925 [Lindgomyces ingoldianus]KAF2472165.1 hypothetical protein BDR25DRAFT_302925 [Lindgomyces ingoldianus]
MAAMESPSAVDLVRTASQNSTTSVSRKTSTVRVRPAKRTSNASLQRAPSPAADTKSLTSFPSLSPTPDSSPVQSRVNGWFRAAVGAGNPGDRNEENIPTSSPDTAKPTVPTELGKNTTPGSTMRNVTKSTKQIVGSLVAVTPSARERSALFDDTPQEPDKVPGNLHYSTSQDIEDVLEHTGAVSSIEEES